MSTSSATAAAAASAAADSPPPPPSPRSAETPLMELSLYDDGSTDGSLERVRSHWLPRFEQAGWRVCLGHNSADARAAGRCGVGWAKNRAVDASTGEFLCFQDADDYMLPGRIDQQLALARRALAPAPHGYAESPARLLIGAGFVREPADATLRYTAWCNSLTQAQLYTQRFRECPLVMPTWFMPRASFDAARHADGSVFCERRGSPEDMMFLYAFTGRGGRMYRVEAPLICYRYHPDSASHAIHRLQLMELRVRAFEEQVLAGVSSFSIWGAGRDGRKFLIMLTPENRRKVTAFGDVDVKKVGTSHFDQETRVRIPIVPWSHLAPPVVVCVGLQGRGTEFEDNLRTAGFGPENEGVTHWLFV